jgi:hypothetical protein
LGMQLITCPHSISPFLSFYCTIYTIRFQRILTIVYKTYNYIVFIPEDGNIQFPKRCVFFFLWYCTMDKIKNPVILSVCTMFFLTFLRPVLEHCIVLNNMISYRQEENRETCSIWRVNTGI